MKYKTGKTYSKELTTVYAKLNKIDGEIRQKLLLLATNHPDAIIGWVGGDDGGSAIKAKNTITPSHLSNLSTNECLNYLIKIESWLEETSSHQQLEINFPQ